MLSLEMWALSAVGLATQTAHNQRLTYETQDANTEVAVSRVKHRSPGGEQMVQGVRVDWRKAQLYLKAGVHWTLGGLAVTSYESA